MEKYKYMIELDGIIDDFTGETTIRHLVSNNRYRDQQEEACMQVEKIIHSIGEASEKYGEVREFHLFYIPAFKSGCDSYLINIVKIDNNGTTLVFCDDDKIIPKECISEVKCLLEQED